MPPPRKDAHDGSAFTRGVPARRRLHHRTRQQEEMIMYPQYAQDAQDAIDHFTVVRESRTDDTIYIQAEAGTGSNYEVVSTRLPHEPDTLVITVLNPWQDAWTLGAGWDVVMPYVTQHWGRGRTEPHGGDIAALTIAIMMVLGHSQEDAVAWVQKQV